jgi:hypothetical protein
MRGAINSKGAEGQPCCALIAVVEITQAPEQRKVERPG